MAIVVPAALYACECRAFLVVLLFPTFVVLSFVAPVVETSAVVVPVVAGTSFVVLSFGPEAFRFEPSDLLTVFSTARLGTR